MAFYNEFPHTRTYDSDLDWLIEVTKKLIECCDSMNEWKEEHEKEYNELKKLYNDIIDGNFPPAMYRAFENWVQYNLYDIIRDLIKAVFFNLTDDGYFIAYFPEQWSDLIFNTTGLDINVTDVDYGHLTISY